MNQKHRHPFPSDHVPPRNVDIWLPPGYAQDSKQHYPVIYMHDGQNLFDPELAFAGVDWGVDPAIQRLIARHKITPPIVVGIWNTDNRVGEYMPEKPLEDPSIRAKVDKFVEPYRGKIQFDVCSDAYLAFIVEELKPWVDAEFRTMADQSHTHIAGSSLGAFISLYAVCQYPDIFCGAGCVSSAWNFGYGGLLPWFRDNLPDPANHRLYFDIGSKETGSMWENRGLLRDQAEMDRHARQAGYVDDISLLTIVGKGHKHHESAWRKRVGGMIKFLLE